MGILYAGLISLLLVCGPAHGARLYAATWADPSFAATSTSANPGFVATSAMAGESLLMSAAPLETDIRTFARSPENPATDATTPIKASEFSSLGIASSDTPFGAVLPYSQKVGEYEADGVVNSGASMSLMALAWLFGIGIIGMGMVGRRRR